MSGQRGHSAAGLLNRADFGSNIFCFVLGTSYKSSIFLSPIGIPTPVCVNVSVKSFINRLNSRGDKIHPCFKAADTLNQFEYCALIRRRLSVPLFC